MKTPKAGPLPRALMLAASAALGALYLLPLWTITLEAPQYPEGLGMLIRVHTISGVGPNDLHNINGLNHYIGMKVIEPGSIPELRFMPWILAGLIAWGVVSALVGRRWMIWSWLVLMSAAAVAGLADFWMWGYDYGHNLDATRAIIKIPGMSYQPPLIGSKKLLNFTAHSWPAIGGWIAFASVGAGAVAVWLTRPRGRAMRLAPDAEGHVGRLAAGLAAVVGLLAGCSAPGPRPIVAGEDVCDHCTMTISQPEFAAELVTPTGKVRRFDSIECLAAVVAALPDRRGVHSLWVADHEEPGNWIHAEDARYLLSDAVRSPMGGGLAAFAPTGDAADAALARLGGRLAGWNDVLRRAAATPGGHHIGSGMPMHGHGEEAHAGAAAAPASATEAGP